jgi:predicted nucleic acid-binding protein
MARPARVMLETNVVINLLKKTPETVAQFLTLLEAQTTPVVNPIVIAEVYAGAFAREHASIAAFFALCSEVDISTETGRLAGEYANRYSKSHSSISLEDYLIAAATKLSDCALWTLNTKHYPMKDIVLLRK